MKKLLIFLGLLLTVAAHAQDISYGLTGRLGGYKTFVSSSGSIGDDIHYGPGLQIELGAWAKMKLTGKSNLQIYMLKSLERQSGGTFVAVDGSRHDIVELKTGYGNASIGLAGVYLYQVHDKLNIGVGVAGRYSLASIIATQKLDFDGRHAVAVNGYDFYANTYHRRVKVYVPLEVQVQLSQRVQLAGQVQLPASNRMAASESVFKEQDLGMTVGVNYTL